jgi:fluoroacetyl-CoA thioesterase
MRARPGAEGEYVHEVRERDLATAFANDVPVLATPILMWTSEIAAMRAVEDQLEPGEMTLGVEHRSAHLAPTPLGFTVTARARLVAVEGKRLRFEVTCHDGRDEVLAGEHDRCVVPAESFRERIEQKAAGGPLAAAAGHQ